MANVHEVREFGQMAQMPVPVTVRRRRPGSLFLMFLLGVICTVAVGVVALSIFDLHGTISWPAGRIEIGQTAPPHLVVQHPTQQAGDL